MLDEFQDKTAEEKIQTAKINLMDEHPFYAYLAEYVNIIEVDPDNSEIPTAAVDYKGHLMYNPDFISDLPQGEIEGIIAHELLHIILEGRKRQRGRNHHQWNIAQDIIINHIVSTDGLSLPDVPYIPDSDGELHIEDHIHIEDISDETFESVYDQIENPDEMESYLDVHIVEGDCDGDEIPQEVLDEMDIDWNEVSRKAQQHAKKQGDEPLGANEQVSKGEGSDIDYTALIQKRLSSLIPRNYTYARPHKSSHDLGFYRPDIKNQKKVNVAVAVDTSGSISDEDLRNFLGEIAWIVSQYPIIDLTIIQHDAEVQDFQTFDNPNKNEFEDLEIKGRGGTNHVPVFDRIEDEEEVYDALICLTDGYTTTPEERPMYDVIWILNNFEVEESRLGFGEILRTHFPNSD